MTPPPVKRSKSRKTLNLANLEALGAERLAVILLEEAEGSATTKRRLRTELAAAMGPEDLTDEITKRLETIRTAKGRVHWRKQKEFRRDLDLQRRMIAGPLAAADPGRALATMLRFVGLERGVLARAADSKGETAEIFNAALGDLAQVAPQVLLAGPELADAILDTLATARVGSGGDIVTAVLPALDEGLVARLRARIEIESAPQRRANVIWRAPLQALLEAQGDAAALEESFSASERVLPPVGARIARAYLSAGQAEQAEAALDRSDPYAGGSVRVVEADEGTRAWDAARIEMLETSGRGEEAQAMRWAAFERGLAAPPLRDYLRRMSGFDDVVAEDRALAHARGYPRLVTALRFLIEWPDLEGAAALVLERRQDIDAADPLLLERAARALEARYPLAATILLRAMVLHVARFARSEFYDAAPTWVLEAASLSTALPDDDDLEPHEAFAGRVAGYRRW